MKTRQFDDRSWDWRVSMTANYYLDRAPRASPISFYEGGHSIRKAGCQSGSSSPWDVKCEGHKTNRSAHHCIYIHISLLLGDLYFAYITQADHTGQLDTDAEYQCRMIVLDKPIETIASRHRLQVIARSDAETKPEFQLSYPTSIKAKKVTCIEGTQCLLSCIFVGR